jgi:hypothetical protein
MALPQHLGAFSASTTFPHPQAHFQYAISNTSQWLSAFHMKHFSYKKLMKRFWYINCRFQNPYLEPGKSAYPAGRDFLRVETKPISFTAAK